MGRRSKGAGTVYEYPQGSGEWWAKLPRDEHGKQPKKKCGSKREAEKWLREKLREREQGLQVVSRQPTIKQWLEDWLANVAKPTVRPNTYRSYKTICYKQIIPHLGDIRIDELKPARIRRWLVDIDKVYSPLNCLNALRLLRSVFKLAINDRVLLYNPTDGIKSPSSDDKRAKVLTEEQVNKLLGSVEGHRLWALYYTEMATGMRFSEIIALRWSNVSVDTETASIFVKEQLQIVDKKLCFVPPKSRSSNREIPIDEKLAEVLRDQRDRLQAEKKKAGDKWEDHNMVFPSEVGTPVKKNNLYRHFKRLLKTAGLPDIRFHDLRHTVGSLMLANGTPITDVSAILGHASVAVTAQVYAHSYAEGQRRAITSLTRNLRRPGNSYESP
ncbi:MAG TPA: site-specific integrase [Roseiflexaceae bacterium]|nr:site-specific integrase [Roseiflexaceae bacterium]